MIDIWRVQHPETRQYTWRRRNPYPIHCRLDMFLISDSIQGCIECSAISPGYRTDHYLISINCCFSDITRGPGYWKLNCSLLRDRGYLDMIQKLITNSLIQHEDEDLSPDLYWEILKMEIRQSSITYSAHKKREQIAEQKALEEEIYMLENKIEKTDHENNRLIDCRNLLKQMYNNKVKGSIVRSRILGYEFGDKPSSYFFSLEKGNQNKKSIYKLTQADGTIIDTKKDILNEISSYYTNLYRKKRCYQTAAEAVKSAFIPEDSHVQLTDNLKDSCEGLVTKQELTDALKKTKNNKSPGLDGIPYEFYKTFWNDIGDLLVESLNYSYIHGKLSINQRRGVISLLPKGNKDILHLTNWRPITLLCCDYKLASKVIASRLKQTLPHIINSCQTGFVSGRYIGENINTILQIIETTEEENIPGLVLSADFSKAFDNLDWDYLDKILKYFNFGDSFQKWIKLFNTDVSAVVNVNGWFTPYMNIEKGARQGDPIAAYLFILCVELLSFKVRTDNLLTGITIGDNSYKICQFADDTILFLDGSQASLDTALEILLQFSHISGLEVNFDKTNVHKIGQLRYLQGIYNTRQVVNWSDGPIETLGVKIPIINRHELYQINYEPKLRDLDIKLRKWGTHSMSLKGKITIIKTFGISKLLYLASVLPLPSKAIITQVNHLIFSFLWNNKMDKIKRNVLINNFENGGLNAPHFETLCKSLKITWVKRYIASSNCQWANLVNYCLQKVGGTLVFRSNLSIMDIDYLKIKSTFWTDVLKSWCEYNFRNMAEIECVDREILWLNSYIRVNNKVLYYAECIRNQILTIGDLYHDNILLDRHLINMLYDTNITVMGYNSLISAIPREWKRYMVENVQIIQPEPMHSKYIKLSLIPQKMVSKHVYSELVNTISEIINLPVKWSNFLPDTTKCTNKCFTHIYKVTIDNVLRSFQYRLLHRILFFNDKLYIFGITNSDSCDLCNNDTDSIDHRMWTCPVIQTLWQKVILWYNGLFNSDITVTYIDVITNKSSYLLLDLIILCTKYYIYKSFVKKENIKINSLIDEILQLEQIEKEIAYRKSKINYHVFKWRVLSTN